MGLKRQDRSKLLALATALALVVLAWLLASWRNAP
jgi:hypothetical protein